MKKVIYNNGAFVNLTGTILAERITVWGEKQFLVLSDDSKEWIGESQVA
jgi:hypothetical protein